MMSVETEIRQRVLHLASALIAEHYPDLSAEKSIGVALKFIGLMVEIERCTAEIERLRAEAVLVEPTVLH
jgi:hypothetical protein